MKKITPEQIQTILDEMLKLNVPVQTYAGLQKLFDSLPAVDEIK